MYLSDRIPTMTLPYRKQKCCFCRYRDLKAESILIDERGHLRLVDFGSAKKVPGAIILKEF